MSLQIACRGGRIRTVFILLVLASGPRLAQGQPPAPTQPPPTAPQPPPTTPEPPPTTTQPPPTTTPEPQTTTETKPADEGVTFIGAGDIANCEVAGGGGARSTALILDRYPNAVIYTTGDHAYQTGSEKEFRSCYEPTWGRFKARTHPAVGNHDLITDKGKPYYDYFGEAAGPRNLGYYSYEVGSWHVIALNSAIPARKGSDQMKWLTEDLAAHKTECTLAYWHIARYSSGAHGSDPLMADAWKILYDAGADVVLASHDHNYERFAPMDDRGKTDDKGIRSFVVGTGGGGVYEFKSKAQNSEVKDNTTYGVLKMVLKPGSYDWEFIPMPGKTFRDSGSGKCSPVK
jgi:acid phosphatase type 7